MRTLRWRLTFWYGGMAAAILILLASILYLSVRHSLISIREEDVRDTASSASQILEETSSPRSAVGKVRRRDVRTVWAIGEVRRQDVYVIIRDADGAVLAETPDAEEPPDNVPADAAYPGVLRDGRYLVTTFDSEDVPGATGMVYSVLPAWDPVLQRLLLIEAAAVAGALALIVGFGPRLAGRALRPLKSVSNVAGELRRGRLGSRVNLPELKSRRDEVGEVARSFDTMAESLERLFEAERESKETLRRFAADASHELRTPLTSIIGYLDVLDESGDKDPVVRRQVLRAIREEGERMARLVEDLLVLARLDTQRKMHVELVDLVTLTRESTVNYSRRQVEFAAPGLVVPVLADREALRRVVSNLLSNAIKHTPPEQRILVSVDREGQEAVLRVADEGVGIPEDALPHVFERFYRAESSRAGEGTGLGLAIVRETVEALEGRIEVESAPATGSTFTVRLPLSERLPKKNVPNQEKLSGKN
ncbi:MAG TPA: HAMP domain-containing sensor histidine kinase [Rubrobacteraceae bacterium]|nr:HAMP domain-containing sensor histidine kinase [Rubrobacteraceae bacterium]